MRDRIVAELGDLAHSCLLVYLMGPYRAFDIEPLVETAANDPDVELDQIPDGVHFASLVGADVNLDQQEATLDLLLEVRDRLRTDPGVNAFLAIDIDVPLEEVDAASQSVQFALASNAIIYVVPQIGDNLGVGIEVGAVLEAIFRQREERIDGAGSSHHERVLFIHESGVRSAMIAAIRDRWDARVYTYSDRGDLVEQVRLFVRDLARRELRGDLPRLDETRDE